MGDSNIKRKEYTNMVCLSLGIYILLSIIFQEFDSAGLIVGIVFLLVGFFLEIRFERFAWKKLKSYLKNKQEISDLENQIKKEKLQKELEELKQQNSN